MATVDFGPDTDPKTAFALQRRFEPEAPLVNSEFYPAWLDVWGKPHNIRDAKLIAEALDKVKH